MSFGKFCAKCGKIVEETLSGMCSECFLKRHDLFEVKDLKIEICVKCKKGRVKGHWHQLSNEIIANEVSSKVKLNHDLDQPKIFVELTPITEIDYSAKITVTGFLNGVLVEQAKTTEFYLYKVSCDACMKLVSNYREAVIQLRASSQSEADAMLEVAKNLLDNEKAKDSLSAIIKTLSGKNSYDLWIGSNKGATKVARKLSKLYKTTLILSKKQTGGGFGKKPEFRFTYSINKK